VVADLTAELQAAQESKADLEVKLERKTRDLAAKVYRCKQWKSRSDVLEEYIDELEETHQQQETQLIHQLLDLRAVEALLRSELKNASDLGYR
jgi:hypothetical protein